MGGPARPSWPRPRSLRPARQHHGRDGLPARDVRPLRQCRCDAGGLQCRSRSLRRTPRDGPTASRRNPRLCRCACADPWRRGSIGCAVRSTGATARLAQSPVVRPAPERQPSEHHAAVRGAIWRRPRCRSGARPRPCGAARRQYFRGDRERRRNAMRAAFPRSAAQVSASSRAGLRPAGFGVGKAERAEGAEGKIKEDGTMSGRFLKLLLSAHWLGEPRAAPRFLPPRAAVSRKALTLLGFERHHRPIPACFRRFWLEPRP